MNNIHLLLLLLFYHASNFKEYYVLLQSGGAPARSTFPISVYAVTDQGLYNPIEGKIYRSREYAYLADNSSTHEVRPATYIIIYQFPSTL